MRMRSKFLRGSIRGELRRALHSAAAPAEIPGLCSASPCLSQSPMSVDSVGASKNVRRVCAGKSIGPWAFDIRRCGSDPQHSVILDTRPIRPSPVVSGQIEFYGWLVGCSGKAVRPRPSISAQHRFSHIFRFLPDHGTPKPGADRANSGSTTLLLIALQSTLTRSKGAQ